MKHPLIGGRAPPWAAAWGEDRYGAFASFTVGEVEHRLRWIVPGTFKMGSPETEWGRWTDEGPQHDVTLTRGYWLGETPVTQGLWEAVMGGNPSGFKGVDRPVEQVSWEDCQEFCAALNGKVPGLFGRLPTEAEWERACRGGTTWATWVGELVYDDREMMRSSTLDTIAWYRGNSDGESHSVGGKAPNPYGLHDMLGNVWEWCQDWLGEYQATLATDPLWPSIGSDRVFRGGAWNEDARGVRATYRYAAPPSYRRAHLGFRLAGGQASALPERAGPAPQSGGAHRSHHPRQAPPREKDLVAANATAQIVQKLWSYSNVLRDYGLSYGDYVEQLTYLLFLKIAYERTQAPWLQKSIIAEDYAWPKLMAADGEKLERQYRKTLAELSRETGMLGVIFRNAQNRIHNPAKLRRFVADLIDREQWTSLDADVMGDVYEGLLEKNAQDTKGGAGQYFTPRPLIQAIVDVMRPTPADTVCDPACGTGGFLLAAHDYVVKHHPSLTREEKKHLKLGAVHGHEIVDSVGRLGAMNLLLHGIGPNADEAAPPITTQDSLGALPSAHYTMVLTNPPFSRKSSVMVVTEERASTREALVVTREDLWATTSNSALNFVQHVWSILKIHGRAAVVVPENVLFEGGAGETVRRRLLQECDVHTLLRLPTGIFYAQGVKASVLFFDKKPASPTPSTTQVWVYDLRTNKDFSLKTKPLRRADLDEFVACYNAEDRHARKATWSEATPEGRWRSYDYAEIAARDKCSLDVF